ncbi:MAG TPA: pyruvate kinase [Ilumatobacteraceae bacterium]|nr:pyruvate kinase [Ilumatobacteraceae bacterium]
MTIERQLDEMIDLADEVRRLRTAMLAAEAAHRERIEATQPRHRRSAANLVHYVELRRHDIRTLQSRLSAIGLSSLGRSESHVLASVEAVLEILDALTGASPAAAPLGSADAAAVLTIGEGDFLLAANATDLLGPQAPHRLARIMVTLPSEAADDGSIVEDMVDAGMDVARINCAHDDAGAWARMVDQVRRDRSAAPLVAMDLGGPKLRTGPLPSGPAVLKLRPQRSPLGEVMAPALVRLVGALTETPAETPTETPAETPEATDIPVVGVDDAAWVGRRVPGELIEVVDARGARRKWTVMDADGVGCVVSSAKTTYLTNGTALWCRNDPAETAVAITGIGPTEQQRRVHGGNRIVLTRTPDAAIDTGIEIDDDLDDDIAVVVGCTLPGLFDAARPGQAIWFDDGKIGGVIEAVTPQRLDARITDVRPGGANLKSAKGINVPDTALAIDALTDQDIEDLDTVAALADIVNLSFVREPTDVRRLQHELARRNASHVGIVLKIENVRAFENLPQLLLTALASERVGVMIARGDLAVEVGFERLAEVQEEIMWLCEAAHVPVIWATQVLESLAKTGRPSRAEVTDAAMSVRAECVMLNKGPYILDAMAALDSILSRMGGHQRKKRSMLRRLTSWDHRHDEGDRTGEFDVESAVDRTAAVTAPELGHGLSATH